MSKPKNRVLCPDCGRQKLVFDTDKKAQSFIDFNWQEITDDKSKLRTYYCPACCGYHISSHQYKGDNKNTDRLIHKYNISINHDDEFFRLVNDCISQNFSDKTELNAYIKTLTVSNYKVADRVRSYLYINYKWKK